MTGGKRNILEIKIIICIAYMKKKRRRRRIHSHRKTVCNQSANSMKRCVFSLCRSWWLSHSIFGLDSHRMHTSPACLLLPPTETVYKYRKKTKTERWNKTTSLVWWMTHCLAYDHWVMDLKSEGQNRSCITERRKTTPV